MYNNARIENIFWFYFAKLVTTKIGPCSFDLSTFLPWIDANIFVIEKHISRTALYYTVMNFLNESKYFRTVLLKAAILFVMVFIGVREASVSC